MISPGNASRSKSTDRCPAYGSLEYSTDTVIGLPESIVMDNGPEFAGRTLDAWAYTRDS